ncbi:class I SAM-dependent methyltransferase [Streptomyces cynarae]|uniref:class I SAM-dependent methyltransferase n=1 Tax=Streptomyces cynarae TaxID=2981134 RepID=UPI00406CBE81
MAADSSVTAGISVALSTPAPPKGRLLFDACPLCSSRDFSVLRTGDCSHHPLYWPVIEPMMTWVQCAGCGHVFTDGYFTPDAAAAIFSATHGYQQPGTEFETNRAVSARIVERIARYVTDGTWLDVGFGNGSLLFTAEEWGFEARGIDLRRSSVEGLQRLGFEADCTDITNLDEPGRFAVISMADVLEHMPFPRNGLAAAHRLLQSDGMLFLSMPNYNCATWRMLDAADANPYWGELEHFHNFSRRRLYALLAEHGFEPVHYSISERYRVCMEVIARRLDT